MGGSIQQAPLSVKNIVVVFSNENVISALETDSGEIRWQFDTPATLWPNSFSTTLEDVMIAGENGRLVAMTTRSGLGEWEIELAAEVLSKPLVDRYLVFAATTVLGIAEDQTSVLYAINASTGEILWQYETANHTLVTPARAGDMVFVGGNQGDTTRLYALAAAEGKIRWKYEGVDGEISAIYADEKTLALLGEQGTLTALDVNSGAPLWRQEFVATMSWITGWGNLLIFEDGASLQAWDSVSGETVWEYQTPDSVVNQPIISNSDLLLLTQSGEIIALNPHNGAESWRFSTESESPTGMVITQGWIFIADEEGKLYAYTSQ